MFTSWIGRSLEKPGAAQGLEDWGGADDKSDDHVVQSSTFSPS